MHSKESPGLNIASFLRIAPSEEGRLKASYLAVSEQGDSVTVTNPAHRTAETKESFNFQRVFYPDAAQAEVYGEMEEKLMQTLFAGRDAGVISFGQSGSGKSYTIFGTGNVSGEVNGTSIERKDDRRGVMLRACRGILGRMEEMGESGAELKVQLYQIRQVTVHNLLCFDSLESLRNRFFTRSLK